MSSLEDEVAAEFAESVRRDKPVHPAGWEPGIAWNGREGTITSRPIAEPTPDWTSLLLVWGFDPATVEIVEPVQVRTWDAAVGNGEVRTMWYYRAAMRTKRPIVEDIADLLSVIRHRKPVKRAVSAAERSHWLSFNDWQLGKLGTKAATEGIVRAIDESASYVKAEARAGRGVGSIYLPGVGDLLEGCDEHYPMQRFEVTLDSREQRRLARRLVLYGIDAHRALAERIVMPVVGGNHGENNRKDGKVTTSFGDNSDVEVYEGVAEACAMNPAAYGHVSFLVPDRDLTLTVQPIPGGPIVGLAHMHQAKRGATVTDKCWNWIRGQALGRRPIGDADIVLGAHWHQLIVHRDGGRLLFIGNVMDQGSPWYAETAGMESTPGMLSFTVNKDGVRDWRLFG